LKPSCSTKAVIPVKGGEVAECDEDTEGEERVGSSERP